MKVCSLYGAGYYYMPGTDICLKLGGFIRYQATYNPGNSVSFGPFELGELEGGEVREVPTEELRQVLGANVIAGANVDFEGPVLERDAQSRRQRREARELERRPRPEPAARPPRQEKPRHRRRDRSSGPRPKYPKGPR